MSEELKELSLNQISFSPVIMYNNNEDIEKKNLNSFFKIPVTSNN